MVVHVLLFGPVARAIGSGCIPVRVGGAPTAGAVREAMLEQYPPHAGLLANGRLAVNHAFARPEEPIGQEDEVALVGLVSGG